MIWTSLHFLLGALKHFLANRRVNALREKRGGHIVHEPLASETNTTLGQVFAGPCVPAPDSLFDREWALSIIKRALEAMRCKAKKKVGSSREFEMLKPWLTGETVDRSQTDAARELGMNEGAVRVAIHRLRRRFRELVKAEIEQTVNDPGDVAEEMRHLIEALS